jgi:hypothetical protein
VGLERGPLILVTTTDELLEIKRSGSSQENRDYGRKDPSRLPRFTLYPKKLVLTSSTSGGRSVGIVRLRTQATEFFYGLHIGCSVEVSTIWSVFGYSTTDNMWFWSRV